MCLLAGVEARLDGPGGQALHVPESAWTLAHFRLESLPTPTALLGCSVGLKSTEGGHPSCASMTGVDKRGPELTGWMNCDLWYHHQPFPTLLAPDAAWDPPTLALVISWTSPTQSRSPAGRSRQEARAVLPWFSPSSRRKHQGARWPGTRPSCSALSAKPSFLPHPGCSPVFDVPSWGQLSWRQPSGACAQSPPTERKPPCGAAAPQTTRQTQQ